MLFHGITLEDTLQEVLLRSDTELVVGYADVPIIQGMKPCALRVFIFINVSEPLSGAKLCVLRAQGRVCASSVSHGMLEEQDCRLCPTLYQQTPCLQATCQLESKKRVEILLRHQSSNNSRDSLKSLESVSWNPFFWF